MLVTLGTRPDGGQRHHVHEVQRADRRLAQISVALPREGGEPGIDGVQRLLGDDETAAPQHTTDRFDLVGDTVLILVPESHGRSEEAIGDVIGAKLLKRRVGVHRLVLGVAVDERALRAPERFPQ